MAEGRLELQTYKVATNNSRVGNSQTNDLLGVDNEDGTDSEWKTLLINVGGVLIVEHVIQIGDFALLVCDLSEDSFSK